jgi:tRNA threonylcarbamoyladenosine biosynthesis protein TsaB
MILCLETATDICSVGIVNETNPADCIIHQAVNNNSHATEITLLIEACLREKNCQMADLKAVAISDGPGSYTSLRVGAATAKGICYALNLPLIAVNTLESLACAALKETGKQGANILYCPMIDARRMEVYCQLFKNTEGVLDNVSDNSKVSDTLIPYAELEAKIIDNQSFELEIAAGKQLIFCGNGAEKCRPLFENTPSVFFSKIETCSAIHLFDLAVTAFHQQQFADTAYHTPQYFKAPNITISKKNVLV